VSEAWRAIEVFVPSHLSAVEVGNYINAEVRITASEAGEFVHQVRIGAGVDHCGDWRKWSASYLPGPPRAFPQMSPQSSTP
jgi:hypothetical protein